MLALPIAFLSFPALVAIGCAAVAVKFTFLSRDLLGAAVTVGLSVFLVRLSYRRASDRLVQLKRRIVIDWNGRRAARFIEEFEQAGRGWFWETTARGNLSYVSEQLAADLKTPAAELIGRPFADLIGLDDRRGTESSERTLGFHLSTRLPFTDINVRANTAAEIWWSLSGTPSFDEYGRFLGFRGIGTDLTQQRQSEEEINRLAKYDSLTGLPNRMLMRRTLDETLQNSSGTAGGCALFLIDLDRFKNVNDTLGHPIGDALLKQVAQRLTTVIGNSGQIGRLGGDEFEAVLPAQDDEGSLGTLAARLIQQVSMPYMIEGHNISIGASVGIAIAPPAGMLRRRPDPQRRPRALFRQGGGPRHLLLLRARNALGGAGPADPRDRPQEGDRPRRAPAPIPAGGQRPDRGIVGLRGAGPLAPSDPRRDQPEPVRAARRGGRPDPFDRRMGAAHGLPRSRQMAREYPRRGQPLADPVRRAEPARDRDQRARQRAARAAPARARDHRGRVPGRERIDRRHVRQAEGDRRPPRARRFRHRLFVIGLFEEGAVRQDQDRPELRARRRQIGQPQRRHHPRHRHPRRKPRHGHDRRGRRDA